MRRDSRQGTGSKNCRFSTIVGSFLPAIVLYHDMPYCVGGVVRADGRGDVYLYSTTIVWVTGFFQLINAQIGPSHRFMRYQTFFVAKNWNNRFFQSMIGQIPCIFVSLPPFPLVIIGRKASVGMERNVHMSSVKSERAYRSFH